MALDIFQIERLSAAWDGELSGRRLLESYSISREDLYLIFEGDRQIRLSFYKGEMLPQWLDNENLPKRNIQNQFSELQGSKVLSVEAYPLDRVLLMRFENELKLLFRMFGSFGQLSFYNEAGLMVSFLLRQEFMSSFRNPILSSRPLWKTPSPWAGCLPLKKSG